MPLTQEIPRQQWQRYFDDLGELYEGWRIVVEVLGRDLGDQPVVEGLPLQGFTYETKGSETGDIIIEAGDTPDTYMTHHVNQPQHVRVSDSEPGAEADVEITSADGTITLVHLRHTAELPAPQPSAAREPTRAHWIAAALLPVAIAGFLLVGMRIFGIGRCSRRE